MPVPMEVRRGQSPPELEIWMAMNCHIKCWELSPSLLQEQHELFATEPPSPVSPIKTYLTEGSCLSQYARQKNGPSKTPVF